MTRILQIAIFDTDLMNVSRLRKILTDIAVQEDIELQINWVTTMEKMDIIPEWTDHTPLVLVNLDMGTFVPSFGTSLYNRCGCWIMYYASGKRDLEPVLLSRPAAFHADLGNACEFRQKFLYLSRSVSELTGIFARVSKGETLQVFYKNILYFESCKKIICLHTANGSTYEFRGKLNDVEKELMGSCFLRVHQSFLVNVFYIEVLNKGVKNIILTGGEHIPVSKSCYDKVEIKLQSLEYSK